MPKVFMQADDGKLSAGHVYGVSQKEFDRLTTTRAQVKLKTKRGEEVRARFVAIPATQDHLKPRVRKVKESGLEPVRMTHDVGRYSAGRLYWFPPHIASMYADGYKSGGRRFAPRGIRVALEDLPERKKKPFIVARVKGVSPRLAAQLATAGFDSPEAIAKAAVSKLREAGLGPKTAEELKAAAKKHLE